MADNTLEAGRGAAAVLDEAHVGDIHGALGSISEHDVERRHTWRARLLTLAAIIGPGIIVMVGDNDAGGVATYSQAGQNYGTTLLWTFLLLIPVLIVNQEMVVRLGAVTGVGHARLIKERFGRFWGMFSVGDLLLLDFLTIVTEFIGVDLALSYFGVSRYVSVPLAAVALFAITASGSFRRWERFMLVFVVANFLVVPLAVFSHPHAEPVFRDLFVPGIRGGVNSTSVLLIIRDRGDDGRPLAALLPAVQHHRQEDHAALDQLRACGHRDRFLRDGDGRCGDRRHLCFRLRAHPILRRLHRRGRSCARALGICSGTVQVSCTPSCS